MKLSTWMISRGRSLAILHDVLVIPLAWFGAYYLRFNLSGIPSEACTAALTMLPVLLVLQTGAYWTVGLYRGIWQFASIPDLIRIFKAVFIGCGLTLLALFLVGHLSGFPRSVLPIYAMVLVLFLGGSRFAVRFLKEKKSWKSALKGGERVLVIGAGRAGEGLVRDLLRDRERNFLPVVFVDDLASKQKQDVHGIRVVGKCQDIPEIVKEYNITLIMIAIPRARAEDMRRIMQFCEGTQCKVHTLPAINDLVAGRVTVDLLRAVSLEDLLGRDPVALDWGAIGKAIKGKRIVVTGAGGSIGSELCRQLAKLQPERLIVIERSEFNLFSLEQEFIEDFPEVRLEKYLMDICDKVGILRVLSVQRPDIIFHAAAYKHVPLLETLPREAIVNNILGTRMVAELAVQYGVPRFVLVSTDKAVNPSNIMGATKRATEMVCHHFNGLGLTKFTTVRFGNVLGSAGSVVPIFKAQLEKGGPITVTHPEITRFFMTIPEACQLILQALSLGQGGEIFVLDMGEPIKIRFLAEQMIRLSGKKLGVDIDIRYTGLRAGEKLHEELFHSHEALEPTVHEKILSASARDLEVKGLIKILDALQDAADHYDEAKLCDLLQILVPELERKSRLTSNHVPASIR